MKKGGCLDWSLIILLVAFGLLFVFAKCSRAQEPSYEDITSEDVRVYEYDGWKSRTKLRSHTWDATERPPRPNERLYPYKDGIQQDGYYQWDGDSWGPQHGAGLDHGEEE